jgi:hypothetical protein
MTIDDSIRMLGNAGVVAALALDRERFADTVQKCFVDYPIIALLTRDANATLTDEAAAALCNTTKCLVTALATASPAARLLEQGRAFRCIGPNPAESTG